MRGGNNQSNGSKWGLLPWGAGWWQKSIQWLSPCDKYNRSTARVGLALSSTLFICQHTARPAPTLPDNDWTCSRDITAQGLFPVDSMGKIILLWEARVFIHTDVMIQCYLFLNRESPLVSDATLCKITLYLHFTCLWKHRKGKENNTLPGLTTGLLSVLGRCQLLCLQQVTGCHPADPSSLISYLANASNFSGAPYKASALPDLPASIEQSRSFEQLPRISLQLPKIVPVQTSDFHRICGNTQNSGTFCPSAADYTKVAEKINK